MTHFKTLDSEIKDENPWWTYRHDTIEYPSGAVGDYFYGETNGGVMIIPVLPDGRIILARQYRYLSDRPSVEFPGGGIKFDEAPAAAAARELLEETGCEAKTLTKIGSFQSLNGSFKNEEHLFLAMGLTIVANPKQTENETIELLHRRSEEFEKMLFGGEIWDAHTLAAWALAGRYVIDAIAKLPRV